MFATGLNPLSLSPHSHIPANHSLEETMGLICWEQEGVSDPLVTSDVDFCCITLQGCDPGVEMSLDVMKELLKLKAFAWFECDVLPCGQPPNAFSLARLLTALV